MNKIGVSRNGGPLNFQYQMKLLFAVILLALVVGCKAPGHLVAGDSTKIRVGMSKEELMKSIGKPDHVYSDGTNETFVYMLERPWWQDIPYTVKIVDNKVASYGDSTVTVIYDKNSK